MRQVVSASAGRLQRARTPTPSRCAISQRNRPNSLARRRTGQERRDVAIPSAIAPAVPPAVRPSYDLFMRSRTCSSAKASMVGSRSRCIYVRPAATMVGHGSADPRRCRAGIRVQGQRRRDPEYGSPQRSLFTVTMSTIDLLDVVVHDRLPLDAPNMVRIVPSRLSPFGGLPSVNAEDQPRNFSGSVSRISSIITGSDSTVPTARELALYGVPRRDLLVAREIHSALSAPHTELATSTPSVCLCRSADARRNRSCRDRARSASGGCEAGQHRTLMLVARVQQGLHGLAPRCQRAFARELLRHRWNSSLMPA